MYVYAIALIVFICVSLMVDRDSMVYSIASKLSVVTYLTLLYKVLNGFILNYAEVTRYLVSIGLGVFMLVFVLMCHSMYSVNGIFRGRAYNGILVVIVGTMLVLGGVLNSDTSSKDLQNYTSHTAGVESTSLTVDRVKQDISLVMSMYDDSSYNLAKSKVNYGGNVTGIYFGSTGWNSHSSYTSKPSVVFKNIGVDLSNDGLNSTYFAVVVVTSSRDGSPTFETFHVTAKYEDTMLVDLIKRRV